MLCQLKSSQIFKFENCSYRKNINKDINDFKMQVSDVQLKIKHQFEEKYNFVEALVVPGICSPLENGNISTVKQNMEFVSELDLADFEDDESTHESRVGISIGVDYYLSIFLGKILKNS